MTTPAPTDDGARMITTPSSAGPKHRKQVQKQRKPVATTVSDWFLNMLALGGVVCIIAVIAAFAFNISLMMFKTGSMSPTIPTGSLAVVREIPASEIEVGDITTVEREDQLPVTHRVTAIEHTAGEVYTIRMQGDANDQEDPHPYEVDTVRKVHWVVPGLGYVVAQAQNPLVMATTTLAMAALVTWVFWPRKRRDK